ERQCRAGDGLANFAAPRCHLDVLWLLRSAMRSALPGRRVSSKERDAINTPPIIASCAVSKPIRALPVSCNVTWFGRLKSLSLWCDRREVKSWLDGHNA